MADRAVIDRIRSTAMNTDELIAKLDTLLVRMDAANDVRNTELAQYYEGQFVEASVEFMSAVESIIDGWYELRGVARPPADVEDLSPEALDELHAAVVDIMHGTPAEPPAPARPAAAAFDVTHRESPILPPPRETPTPRPAKGPRHKVDITG